MHFDPGKMSCCGLCPLRDLLGLLVLAVIYGFIPMLNFIWQIIRKGPTHVFRCKSRNVKPEILTNSEFGTHTFYRLPVRIAMPYRKARSACGLLLHMSYVGWSVCLSVCLCIEQTGELFKNG